MTEDTIGPRTKGLRVPEQPLSAFRCALQQAPQPINNWAFAYPILTADEAAVQHNLSTMAQVCEQYGVWLAPHIKTHMAPDLWRRQSEAGAWAPTVAMPHQLRTAYDWGAKRILLANELVDRRDLEWLCATMVSDPELEVYLEVDSIAGVVALAKTFFPFDYLGEAPDPELVAQYAARRQDVRDRLHPLVEIGVPGGRTGVRSAAEAVGIAQALADANLQVAGVIGFEGPVAATASSEDLAAVTDWVDWVIDVAEQVHEVTVGQARSHSPTPSSCGSRFGGYPAGRASAGSLTPQKMRSSSALAVLLILTSSYLGLPRFQNKSWQGVIRSGSYATHDAVHYKDLNPWSRLPGDWSLQPALTVHAQVLSIPEPGLALLGAGKRDVASDLDLPIPVWHRPTATGLALYPVQEFQGAAIIKEINDQHTFLQYDDSLNILEVGDVVGLSPSHPCTQFDKWRVMAITDGDNVIDLYPLDF